VEYLLERDAGNTDFLSGLRDREASGGDAADGDTPSFGG
jgi:hypothetical protein